MQGVTQGHANARAFTLYRFFASDDTLLYVGLTINPGRRMEKHRDTQPWWPDVARIAMEQHSSLDELRKAERAAIKAEKPLHNIRMNGESRESSTAAPPAFKIEGLVGRWFHSWRPATEDDGDWVTKRGGRVLVLQGRILERVEHELYLIETFSWMDGTPYEQELIHVSEMGMWTFYSNNIEMIASLGCREYTGRGADRHLCGGLAEYITVDKGIGSTACCDHCAGYYGAVQPIIWRDGFATLGTETRVPHPLSVEGMARR